MLLRILWVGFSGVGIMSSDPGLASAKDAVTLVCNDTGDAAQDLCRGLADALRSEGRQVECVEAQTEALAHANAVELHVEKVDAYGLTARIDWIIDAQRHRGDPLSLDIMDAPLAGHMLSNFALDLLRLTPEPAEHTQRFPYSGESE